MYLKKLNLIIIDIKQLEDELKGKQELLNEEKEQRNLLENKINHLSNKITSSDKKHSINLKNYSENFVRLNTDSNIIRLLIQTQNVCTSSRHEKFEKLSSIIKTIQPDLKQSDEERKK